MRKLLVIGSLITTMAMTTLVGCGNQVETANYTTAQSSTGVEVEETKTVEDMTEEAEVVEEEVIVNPEIVSKLKEKFTYKNSAEYITTFGNIFKISLPEGYNYEVVNSVDEEKGIETVVKITSPDVNGYTYKIKVFDVPFEKEEFLLDNPIKIEDTKDEYYNNIKNIISMQNTPVDMDIKVYDHLGEAHDVIKYEVKTDLSILKEEGLGIYREVPTYFAVECDNSYIVMLITEEVSEVTPVEETLDEDTETVEQVIDEQVVEETTESAEETTESAERVAIVEEIVTSEEELASQEHQDMINKMYEEFDDKTLNRIETFKKVLLETDIQTRIDGLESAAERVDKLGFSLLSNMMIGRFE